MKTVENLVKGEVLLTQIRKVAGGKYQVEIAEIVTNPESFNVAAELNFDDERFTQTPPKPKRTWKPGSPAGILKIFGIDVNKLKFEKNEKGQDVAQVNKLNPVYEGKKACIQVTETLYPVKNNQKPKQVKGEILRKNGIPIYADTDLVFGEPKHKFIKNDPINTVVTTEVVEASEVETLN